MSRREDALCSKHPAPPRVVPGRGRDPRRDGAWEVGPRLLASKDSCTAPLQDAGAQLPETPAGRSNYRSDGSPPLLPGLP